MGEMEKKAQGLMKSSRTIWVEYDARGSDEKCLQDLMGS
jgi:hypothetical protein